MKKAEIIVLIFILLSLINNACAAKARSISSDFDSAYHVEHLELHIGEIGCHATGNYIKTKDDENVVIGHLEQADEFVLIDVRNGKALIQITFSHKRVQTHRKIVNVMNLSIILLMISTMSMLLIGERHIMRIYLEGKADIGISECQLWFSYIGGDDIPELLIDTRTTVGGCYAITYSNGAVSEIHLGSSGYPAYVYKRNVLWYTGGHQGSYYDAVYAIDGEVWRKTYFSEHFEFLPQNGSSENDIIRTYYINESLVSKNENFTTLNMHINTQEAIKLLVGMDYSWVCEYLSIE